MDMIFENEVEQTMEIAFGSDNEDHGDEDVDESDRLVPNKSSAPKRILIADDQTINIQVLTAKFQELKRNDALEICHNGRQAFDKIKIIYDQSITQA